ncbi:ATP-binding cassette domain-containing protein [Pseudidiomarina sp.]|uniref:ATP-binding cassette domain-containing protein n=1 Tax=Pseudidiomarina sp. TaxID=2081707 RepID=UPI00299EACED|nr:ATP-binding cassette domain-containing protein [Pseudidiomarina sp.]MDX1705499.1 ATP-binding cassette domain-containing protein [Pseudidiomarina sp.]
MGKTVLSTSDISMRWPDHRVELPPIQVNAGEVLGIMGPSGSGKSTLLRWLVGEQQQFVRTVGSIFVDGVSVQGVPVEQRKIGILFQDVLLFPHLNVFDNLRFGLPAAQRQLSIAEQTERIMEQLRAIQMSKYAQAAVSSLSGGQRARIGLLRALLNKPRVMLLDEPFAALDARLRCRIREWTYGQLAEQQVATIVVSHDPDDIPANANKLYWPEARDA